MISKVNKLLIIVALIFSLSGITSAQWISTPLSSNTFQTFNSASFFDSLNVFFVGSGGVLCKTTDGGQTWTSATLGSNSEFIGSFARENGNGWIVGSKGTLLKSTDFGLQWFDKGIDTLISFRGIYVVADSVTIAVGDSGKIIRSTNGGDSWTAINSPINTYLRDVKFINDNTGFIVGGDFNKGGYIFKTTDAGLSWSVVKTTTSILNKIDVNSTGVAVAVGTKGYVYYSSNFGTNWYLKSGFTDQWLYDVKIVDNLNYFVFGGNIDVGYCAYTENNGANWSTVSLPSSQWVYCCTFPKDDVGYVAGFNGKLFRITKSTVPPPPANPWLITELNSNVNTILYSIKHFDNNNIVCVGTERTLIHSTDAGQNWSAVNTSTSASEFLSVAARANGTGWAAGTNGVILKTTDFGATWNTNFLQLGGLRFNGITALDDSTVIAVGDSGIIYKTQNAGGSWVAKTSPVSTPIRAIAMHSSNLLYAVGGAIYGNGFILKSTDAGESWTLLRNTEVLLTAVFAYSDLIVFTLGTNGYQYKTFDGGVNWNYYNSGTPHWLYALNYFSGENGFVIGGNVDEALLNYTSDDGESWSRFTFTDAKWLYGCTFLNDSVGYVCGYNGKLYKLTRSNLGVGFSNIKGSEKLLIAHNYNINWAGSSAHPVSIDYSIDGKNSWHNITSGVSNLNSINWLTPSQTSNTVHLRIKVTKSNGAIEVVSKQFSLVSSSSVSGGAKPVEFDLLQNFPNPFNPNTKITFTLSEQSKIRLVIYNQLGQEVSVLCNGEFTSGIHTVDFKANHLSSGVYFSELTVGNKRFVKKLLLQK